MSLGSQKILSPEEIAVRAGEQLSFLHLPEPGLFAERARRLRALAEGHAMRDFLLFVAELAEAQHRALSARVAVPLPAPADIAAAADAGEPLLPAATFPRAAVWRASLRGLLADLACHLADGPARATALRLAQAGDEPLEAQAGRLLSGVMLGLDLAGAPLIAAGLQLHWVRLVQQTAAAHAGGPVAPFGRIDDPTACPCCGSPPVASVERLGGEGARYLACGLCATQWHYVRIKCTRCQSTKGVSLQSLVATDDCDTTTGAAVQAECCSECGHYLKLMHPARDNGLEPVADDLASLTLDLLVSEGGLQRHGLNLLLLFGAPDEAAPPGREH
ncbi:formate dehydrogenase accessory protein FdhE [Pelomonas aquatica]|jgi:FdhE protein|uniref:Formate dehydrogenase accessory protein FdhE n=1 Tax=Pelomonas aquatica TaxID=431058 RepID=A0A9X4R5E6_9BURK|nr:formate dehydrogenase accessory protein FdhE [Pelomonas aquatica]MCY4754535.1 formate dehydrogenase accessory protein FdhE [Pelomonas aquatica]MDG0863640.1 formate dehydrogenase accessory protein FdhE [Pelomonas aquatica]